MRSTIIKALIGGMFGAALMGASAGAAPIGAGVTETATAASALSPLAAEPVQYVYTGPRRVYGGGPYYGRPGYGRPVYGRPVYGRPYYGGRPGYYRRGYRGDGVAAGVAAGALGALAIGGLAASGAFDPQPQYAPMAPERRQWCAQRYRSYNPADGTFVGNDGRRRFCG